MRCFKVVGRNFRSVVVREKERRLTSTSDWDFSGEVFANRYSLRYSVGSVVEAVPGSLGLFCFGVMADLLNWVPERERHLFRVVECRGYGRTECPETISGDLSEGFLEQFYNRRIPLEDRRLYCRFGEPVPGTVLFRKVRVMREVSWGTE